MVSRRLGVLVVSLVACGAPPGARAPEAAKPKKEPALVTPTPARDPEPALAELLTGALAPITAEPIELEPMGAFVGPEFETLKFRFSPGSRRTLEATDVAHVE